MRKRSITLLEVMIVILLIGLIGSAIGINMKGSLDKAKAFKTEESIKRIHDALMLYAAEHGNLNYDGLSSKQIGTKINPILQTSGFFKDEHKILLDGWGNPYTFTANGDDLTITSAKLDARKKS